MNPIVIYHLKQETPMWHFQYREKARQNGATLRGSDVKPRLDKFLIKQMKSEGIKWKEFKVSEDHDALNYKIQIVAKGKSIRKDMGEGAFFANMGKDIDDAEQTVFYEKGIDVKITCFISDLMDQIDKHIQAFFIIHNFGTRQDKGFGSFIIDQKDGIDVDFNVREILLSYSSAEGYTAYNIDVSGCNDRKILDNAYVMYQWMKSGINFGNTYEKSLLTKYMLKKHIGGEKRWMKEDGISPKVKKMPNGEIVEDDRAPEGEVSEHKYIRAVMGTSGNQSWVTDVRKKDRNGNPLSDKRGRPIYERVDIAVSSKEIERFQSPITIKVIDNKVVFLVYDLNTPDRNALFDKEFTFKNSSSHRKGRIHTVGEFNMEDFMAYCANEIKNKQFSLRGNRYQYTMNKITAGGNN